MVVKYGALLHETMSRMPFQSLNIYLKRIEKHTHWKIRSRTLSLPTIGRESTWLTSLLALLQHNLCNWLGSWDGPSNSDKSIFSMKSPQYLSIKQIHTWVTWRWHIISLHIWRNILIWDGLHTYDPTMLKIDESVFNDNTDWTETLKRNCHPRCQNHKEIW
jgi:hypothetical protein